VNVGVSTKITAINYAIGVSNASKSKRPAVSRRAFLIFGRAALPRRPDWFGLRGNAALPLL
jgi:hypothetical protein